ncbi:MAG: PhzF family phenazine biosynthesis protein [Planctomycetota bacterium]
MPLPLYIVDAFTDRAFAGNPAAVCVLETNRWPDSGWMQAVAAEMNLSETAFVRPPAGGTNRGNGSAGPVHPIRYFTPTIEVALCGHATLASAHVWFAHRGVAPDRPIAFRTTADQTLTCSRADNGAISMEFPAHPVLSTDPAEAPVGLHAALGVEPEELLRVGPFWLARLGDAAAVRDLRPDHTALAQLAWGEAHGVVVTARGGATPDGRAADFSSRFFAPAAGIPEDPVTGSAHCALGPYWAERLGRHELLAFQASARGGVLDLRIDGPRVSLGGRAVTTVLGQWVGPDPAE